MGVIRRSTLAVLFLIFVSHRELLVSGQVSAAQPNATISCGPRPPNCRAGDRFPVEDNCKKYHECNVRGMWDQRVCTGRNNFHARSLRCVPQQQAVCCSRAASGGALPQYGSADDPACKVLPTFCPGRLILPIPGDCNSYRECTNGAWIKRNCPNGAAFDKHTLRCIHTRDAICQLPCPPRPRVECELREPCSTGLSVGNPTDCSRYYTCRGGRWRSGVCTSDVKYFNSYTRQCQRSAQNCTFPCPVTTPTPIPTTTSPSTTASTTVPTTTVPTTTPTTATSSSTPTTTSTVSETTAEDQTDPVSTTPRRRTCQDVTYTMDRKEVCASPNRDDHSSCHLGTARQTHRHPTDCRVYFVCINIWIRGACPDGEYFDTTVCDCRPQNTTECIPVPCGVEQTTLAPAAPVPTTTASQNPSTDPTTTAMSTNIPTTTSTETTSSTSPPTTMRDPTTSTSEPTSMDQSSVPDTTRSSQTTSQSTTTVAVTTSSTSISSSSAASTTITTSTTIDDTAGSTVAVVPADTTATTMVLSPSTVGSSMETPTSASPHTSTTTTAATTTTTATSTTVTTTAGTDSTSGQSVVESSTTPHMSLATNVVTEGTDAVTTRVSSVSTRKLETSTVANEPSTNSAFNPSTETLNNTTLSSPTSPLITNNEISSTQTINSKTESIQTTDGPITSPVTDNELTNSPSTITSYAPYDITSSPFPQMEDGSAVPTSASPDTSSNLNSSPSSDYSTNDVLTDIVTESINATETFTPAIVTNLTNTVTSSLTTPRGPVAGTSTLPAVTATDARLTNSPAGSAVPNTSDSSTNTPPLVTATAVVLPGTCKEDFADNHFWEETPINGTVDGPCPKQRSGMSVRRCTFRRGKGAVWDPPDYQLCVDENFERVLDQVQTISAPPQGMPNPGPAQVTLTALQLARITTEAVREDEGIKAGNLNASVEAITGLTQLVDTHNTTFTFIESRALFTTASNVLSPKNNNSWEVIRQREPRRAVAVMAAVDRIGQQIVNVTGGSSITVQADNLVLKGEIKPKDQLESFEHESDLPKGSSPTTAGVRDRVVLERETLEELSEDLPGDTISVWSVYYQTLDGILPVDGKKIINSRVISLSVQALPNGQILNPPVTLYQAARRVIDNAEAQCSYWNFSAGLRGRWEQKGCWVNDTNDNRTICKCNHLTNFAILMSPYPIPEDGHHATILSIISVVGCLLSILGMLVTICLYILSWKRVKSHHAAVLLNLCIALIVANTVFLAGINRTEDKVICMAISAMLHFFYLAAFFLMFADGVQFILYVVQVFHVRRKKETFLLIFTCWVLPAVVVGISLSITRGEGYGTELYCWLRKDSGLIAAFAVPALLVMIANFIILCKILHTISNSKGSERTNRVKATLWNVAVMMPLLGITWVFGLFSVNDETIAFQYIFAVSNSLQGFFIFFFHCALNKKMRQAVAERFSSRSSNSSSLRKSGGSNKSDKKKDTVKPTKKGNTKKQNISPPKPVGRQVAYIAPRQQVATPTADCHQTSPQTEPPPAEDPAVQEPHYMELDDPLLQTTANGVMPPMLKHNQIEQQRTPPQPHKDMDQRLLFKEELSNSLERRQQKTGGSNQKLEPESHSLERPSHSPETPRKDDQFSLIGHTNPGYDDSQELYYQNVPEMKRPTPPNVLERRYGFRVPPSFDADPQVHSNSLDRQQPSLQRTPPNLEWQRHHSLSLDDLRRVDQDKVDNPWAQTEEDPYLTARQWTDESDMEMQVNPLLDRQAATFDPRRESRRSPYLQDSCRHVGSSHSLDRLGRLPRRNQESAAGVSTNTLQRFASKDTGQTYIMLDPQVYETIEPDGIKGHSSEEPVYMQIGDVTVVDSQMSGLDYLAGRA